MTYQRCKEDCYWYEEEQDMAAHIPCCRCKGGDFIKPQDCDNCEQYHSKYNPTNADKIRMMTDEELAMFIDDVQKYNIVCRPILCNDCADCRQDLCWQCWREWLKKEIKT